MNLLDAKERTERKEMLSKARPVNSVRFLAVRSTTPARSVLSGLTFVVPTLFAFSAFFRG